MSSSQTKIAKALLAALAVLAIAGCIADTAEDSNLPWSSNRSWEGMAPIAPSVMDRYE
jgi:hypothetical protein